MGQLNRKQRRAAKKAAPKKRPEGHKLTNRERIALIEKNGITAKDLKHSYEEGQQAAMRVPVNYVMNMFFCACAIALHREFGFGEKRIMRVLTATEKIMIEELTTEDITERCKRETGLEVDVRDEGFDDIFRAD